jgi:hypothetical protein
MKPTTADVSDDDPADFPDLSDKSKFEPLSLHE